MHGLSETLYDHTWRPLPLRCFKVTYPKPRIIQAPACADRIVHHAIMRHLIPEFERRFVSETYACRTNKGPHKASESTTKFLRAAFARWDNPYVLQGDVSNFFASIAHDVLLERLHRLISDRDIFCLFETIICKTPGYESVGLPLGSMTSQWFANLILDALDHYVKDELAVPYYVRYMDDWVLIGPDKQWCRSMLEQITKKLEMLRLTVNPKTDIFPASYGIDFVGYRHWVSHKLPRKKTVKRNRSTLKTLRTLYNKGIIDLDYVRPRIASFAGYMKHCDSFVTMQAILDEFVLIRHNS